MSAQRLTLQMFAKAPVPGTVKTRLVPALSPAGAAMLHGRLVAATADALSAARASLGEAIVELWCAPDCSDPFLVATAGRHGFALREQAGDDLGARMRNALAGAMPGIAILVGSDCPLLDAPLLVSAVQTLEAANAVFLPTEDGGYALVGCRDRVPDAFDGIAWSTSAVMRETRSRLAMNGTHWIELPTAWDVDTPNDVLRLAGDVRFAQLVAGLPIDDRRAGRKRLPHPL